MPDDPYSLADLARLADVTPRTIRYYVAQGLLPSPDAAGPATRYGDGHLARLRLIRRLQRDHLPLAEIRIRLERLGNEEVQALLDVSGGVAPEPSRSAAETLSYVREMMANAGVSPHVHERVTDEPEARPAASVPAAPPPALAPASAQGPSIRPLPGAALLRALKPHTSSPPPGFYVDPAASRALGVPAPDAPAPDADPDAVGPAAPGQGSGSRPVAGDRSTWERLVISADVELHVRRPLDRAANKRVDQLTRIARELFDEET